MENRLSRLPVELFSLILGYFSAPELMRCIGPVSKAFRRLSQMESVWAELLDRDGIRSFARRLDRRERIHRVLNLPPLQMPQSAAALLSFLVSPGKGAADGGVGMSSLQAYERFCAVYNASTLLARPHECCPNGHHPDAITDDLSDGIRRSAGSVFTLFERLWGLVEDWLLRNGMLPHYLSFGSTHVQAQRAVEAGESIASLAAFLTVARGGQQTTVQNDDVCASWEVARRDPAVADVAALLPQDSNSIVSTAGFELMPYALALFGVGQYYHELMINYFAPMERTVQVEVDGWMLDLLPVLRCNHRSFVAVVTAVDAASGTAFKYKPGHVVHCNMEGRLLGLSPNIETFVFQWVRDVCLLQRFDYDYNLRGISRFPRYGHPQLHSVSTAVTLGVEVTMAACLIPAQSGPRTFQYAYKCRLRLLPDSPFPSVQLTHRRWKITNLTSRESEVVEGEGVVGHTPILIRMSEQEAAETRGDDGLPNAVIAHRSARTKIFTYASVTHFNSPKGVMEGHFRFVPGTSAVPYGDPFLATVAPFYCCFNEDEKLTYGEW